MYSAQVKLCVLENYHQSPFCHKGVKMYLAYIVCVRRLETLNRLPKQQTATVLCE